MIRHDVQEMTQLAFKRVDFIVSLTLIITALMFAPRVHTQEQAHKAMMEKEPAVLYDVEFIGKHFKIKRDPRKMLKSEFHAYMIRMFTSIAKDQNAKLMDEVWEKIAAIHLQLDEGQHGEQGYHAVFQGKKYIITVDKEAYQLIGNEKLETALKKWIDQQGGLKRKPVVVLRVHGRARVDHMIEVMRVVMKLGVRRMVLIAHREEGTPIVVYSQPNREERPTIPPISKKDFPAIPNTSRKKNETAEDTKNNLDEAVNEKPDVIDQPDEQNKDDKPKLIKPVDEPDIPDLFKVADVPVVRKGEEPKANDKELQDLDSAVARVLESVEDEDELTEEENERPSMPRQRFRLWVYEDAASFKWSKQEQFYWDVERHFQDSIQRKRDSELMTPQSPIIIYPRPRAHSEKLLRIMQILQIEGYKDVRIGVFKEYKPKPKR